MCVCVSHKKGGPPKKKEHMCGLSLGFRLAPPQKGFLKGTPYLKLNVTENGFYSTCFALLFVLLQGTQNHTESFLLRRFGW